MCYKDSVVTPSYLNLLDNILSKDIIITHWHQIAASQNPADILSRVALLPVLGKCELWCCGPRISFSDLPKQESFASFGDC